MSAGMTPNLYLAPDHRGELALWQHRPDDSDELIHRQSDLHPIAWAILVLAVGLPREAAS